MLQKERQEPHNGSDRAKDGKGSWSSVGTSLDMEQGYGSKDRVRLLGQIHNGQGLLLVLHSKILWWKLMNHIKYQD